MFKLRGYQEEAVDAVFDYYLKGRNGNVLVSLPTGSGKSIVMAALVERIIQQTPQVKFLSLTHRKELLSQNEAELNKHFPHITTSMYSAGLGRRELGAQVSFAGVQSVYTKAKQFQEARLVLIDESHLCPKSGNGMYRRFINELLEYNPNIKIIGFTATPYRFDSGLLTHGEDALFQTVVYEANVKDLVDQGYLAPLTSRTTSARIETEGIGTRLGDFIIGELEIAADKEEITDAMIDDLDRDAKDRKSILVFCTGVDHANHVRNALRMRGYSSEVVTGDTPSEERADILERFKRQELRTLVNVDVLTVGFNSPNTDCIVSLRPTRSTGLWVQMLGRGMRLKDNAPDCLVLDYGGNIDRHGPIDQIKPQIKEKRTGSGEAPTKTCVKCYAECPAGVRFCPECGTEFPAPKHGLEMQYSLSPVMSDQKGPSQTFNVDGVYYRKWQKPGKDPTLRVDYHCGIHSISEWVGIGHQGWYGEKAYRWWMKRDPEGFMPLTVDAALKGTYLLREPVTIKAHKEGRFWKIDAYNFAKAEDECKSILYENRQAL